ncbi:MAG: ABC-F family ATP-binding cassette domain-containing protein [Dehalococcoidia bacterium]
MILVSVSNLSVSFGAFDVLDGVSCQVEHGARVGLIGRNGAGKTTLLRALAGTQDSTRGRRHTARGMNVELVEQVPPLSKSATVYDLALSSCAELVEMERELERTAGDLARSSDDDAAARYEALHLRFEAAGGFRYRVLVEEVLTGLGFMRPSWERPVEALSGGERSRLGLARALAASPDVLLMDEPTNHLDLDGLRWLEGFLGRWRGAFVVTSHDRYFLDQVATRIWLLADGRLQAYPGNYSKFEALRTDQVRRQQLEYEAQREVIEKEEAFIRRYKAGQRAREARGRQKRLDRVERLEAPRHERNLRLQLGASRSGHVVFSTEGLSAGYAGKRVVRVDKLQLERGSRIALLGPNGSGKSTLLKTIAGELTPVDGEFRLGAAVRVAHYWQEAEGLDPRHTVLEEVLGSRNMDLQPARDLLGRFLFSGDDIYKPISALSGGERSRLALLRLLLAEANLLLLDEPTNHLDIPARESLGDALSTYKGTLIFASHDRRLIGDLATSLWLIEDGTLRAFDGTLAEYDRLRATPAPAPEAPGRPPPRPAPAPRTGPTPEETSGALEAGIHSKEEALAALGDEINAASERGDVEAVRDLGARFREAQAELDHLLEEWARSDR